MTSSTVNLNATWLEVDQGWEVFQQFGNLSLQHDWLFSLWITTETTLSAPPRKSSSLPWSIYAQLNGPTGFHTCTLCAAPSSSSRQALPSSVNGASAVPTSCVKGSFLRCFDNELITRNFLDPAPPLDGGFSFRITINGDLNKTTRGFRATMYLSEAAQATDDANGTTPSFYPTYTTYTYSQFDKMPENVTTIWLFCVVFFVAMCAYRVWRRHRLNAMLGEGAGGTGGYDEEDLREMVLRRQITVSPLVAASQPHRLQAVPDAIPRAQARVLSPQEAAAAEADETTPRAVVAAAVAEPASMREYRL